MELKYLTSETVQGASLPLEGIDNIHGGDGLPLGVLTCVPGVWCGSPSAEGP